MVERGRFVVSLTRLRFPSSLAPLPIAQRRQICFGSHLQTWRDAPRSHPDFPPQRQADSHQPILTSLPEAAASRSLTPARARITSAVQPSVPVPETHRLQEKPHLPSRNRCISASSSAIQAAVCSRENLRGSGIRAPCARRRAARKSINSCFCSGGSASAAASISARLLMGAD